MAGHPYLDVPGPIGFAHRGGAVEGVENTLTAFEAAYELGFRYFETDVHLTADGVVVAFHDSRLDRVTDRAGHVGDLTWAQVRQAVVGDRERIPSLAELLDAFPDARFNIDAKSDAVLEPLLELLSDRRVLDRVCLGSFSDRRLRRARASLGDELCTSAGPVGVLGQMFNTYARDLLPSGALALQVPIRWGRVPITTQRFVDSCHSRCLPVHVWTIDDPEVMHELLDIGVDGIMTDRPAVLRSVFAERGLKLG